MTNSRTLYLELIDGCGPMRARYATKAKQPETMCHDERHCAHHGNNPFFCCRCGAVLEYDDQDGAPHER